MSDSFEGRHNSDLESSRHRVIQANTYKDCSTVIVIPAIAPIEIQVVMSWMGLMCPMNQRVFRIPVTGAEVGDAYNQAVDIILGNPELSAYRYMLTLETDNLPPPDGLLKLYESIENYDAVGGLYWTKGEGGMPMIYGDPMVMPKNFVPQPPQINTVQPCNGLGMGFTLFRIDMFRKMPKPWFKTIQEYEPGIGGKAFTQDLWFFSEAAKFGFKFAVDTRVKVGHLDPKTKIVW